MMASDAFLPFPDDVEAASTSVLPWLLLAAAGAGAALGFARRRRA